MPRLGRSHFEAGGDPMDPLISIVARSEHQLMQERARAAAPRSDEQAPERLLAPSIALQIVQRVKAAIRRRGLVPSAAFVSPELAADSPPAVQSFGSAPKATN